MQRHFRKWVNARELQSSVQGAGQAQLLVEDGDHQVNRHRNPNLGLHRVGPRAEKMLAAQMSFDPSEEEFDLPAHPVNVSDLCSGNFEVVAQEDQIATGLGIEVTHFAKRPGKGLARGGERRLADLIAANPGGIVDREGTLPL